jgi:hypothetical protein
MVTGIIKIPVICKSAVDIRLGSNADSKSDQQQKGYYSFYEEMFIQLLLM